MNALIGNGIIPRFKKIIKNKQNWELSNYCTQNEYQINNIDYPLYNTRGNSSMVDEIFTNINIQYKEVLNVRSLTPA